MVRDRNIIFIKQGVTAQAPPLWRAKAPSQQAVSAQRAPAANAAKEGAAKKTPPGFIKRYGAKRCAIAGMALGKARQQGSVGTSPCTPLRADDKNTARRVFANQYYALSLLSSYCERATLTITSIPRPIRRAARKDAAHGAGAVPDARDIGRAVKVESPRFFTDQSILVIYGPPKRMWAAFLKEKIFLALKIGRSLP